MYSTRSIRNFYPAVNASGLRGQVQVNGLDAKCQEVLHGLLPEEQAAILALGETIEVDPAKGSANSRGEPATGASSGLGCSSKIRQSASHCTRAVVR